MEVLLKGRDILEGPAAQVYQFVPVVPVVHLVPIFQVDLVVLFHLCPLDLGGLVTLDHFDLLVLVYHLVPMALRDLVDLVDRVVLVDLVVRVVLHVNCYQNCSCFILICLYSLLLSIHTK